MKMSKSQHCRILFWNIKHGGGSRAGGIVEQIMKWEPDIVALAEFRGTAASQSIAQGLFDEGYVHQVSAVNHDEPSWNAVFLASRFKLNQITQSLPNVPYGELYWLLAKVDAKAPFHIGVVHAPWSIYLGRLEYYAALIEVAEKWQHGPGVIIGDMNTGVTGLDEETENSVEYHKSVMEPLEDIGWRDMFRVFQPEANWPTWYSPYGNGYRLDQAFANKELQPLVQSCIYNWGKQPESGDLSDHAAILLDFKR